MLPIVIGSGGGYGAFGGACKMRLRRRRGKVKQQRKKETFVCLREGTFDVHQAYSELNMLINTLIMVVN